MIPWSLLRAMGPMLIDDDKNGNDVIDFGDETNKKDIEDDINSFHAKLTKKKVKFWA